MNPVIISHEWCHLRETPSQRSDARRRIFCRSSLCVVTFFMLHSCSTLCLAMICMAQGRRIFFAVGGQDDTPLRWIPTEARVWLPKDESWGGRDVWIVAFHVIMVDFPNTNYRRAPVKSCQTHNNA